jgi:hypothetical protein
VQVLAKSAGSQQQVFALIMQRLLAFLSKNLRQQHCKHPMPVCVRQGCTLWSVGMYLKCSHFGACIRVLMCALLLPAACCVVRAPAAVMLCGLPAGCCSEPEPLLVNCVVWSANGRHLLSGHSKPEKGHADKTEKVKAGSRIILWDVLTGKQVRAAASNVGIQGFSSCKSLRPSCLTVSCSILWDALPEKLVCAASTCGIMQLPLPARPVLSASSPGLCWWRKQLPPSPGCAWRLASLEYLEALH